MERVAQLVKLVELRVLEYE
ncbi:hypothetical protein L195_g063003, partial [Trifolium pratense]